MKKFLIPAVAAALCACGGNVQKKSAETVAADTHYAENSLEYFGIYKGTLPAADCPGIETTLTLRPDGQYDLMQKYIDRDTSFDETGRYTIDGNLLMLKDKDTESYYKIEENRLRMLDGDRREITGPLAENYTLTKTN